MVDRVRLPPADFTDSSSAPGEGSFALRLVPRLGTVALVVVGLVPFAAAAAAFALCASSRFVSSWCA